MLEVRQSAAFAQWMNSLTDQIAIARINARILRLAHGNAGDAKMLGDGVSELRIDHGPGYRVYYTMRGQTVVLLLCGGDKRRQNKNIKTAQQLAKEA